MKTTRLTPQFVDAIPENIEEGVLYISEQYCTAIHRCCCGCRKEVVTPLSPIGWRLQKQGQAVSLYPSIGNWNFPCKSHYWIRRNNVAWAKAMSNEQIKIVAERDDEDLKKYVEQINQKSAAHKIENKTSIWSLFWKTLKKWLRF